MTKIATDFASKLAVAFVAVAMVFAAFAPAAQAQSTEDLQQMINDLLAQVAQLQAGTSAPATSAAGVCPYTWTRSLTTGSEGADVMKLQQFLNADADTRVAAEGAGSVGMETMYYGPATAAAVSKMQVKYRADVLSPAGLVNPTGYFGPSTMAKANSLCTTAPVVDDMDDEDMTDEDEDSSDEDEDMTLGGEASLEDFEVDDADDSEVEEGNDDVPVAEITVKFSDGDAEISRMDIAFTDAAGADSDAWDVFETASLWIDGDKVAEEDMDSKSDYLGDEDDGIIRFSGLDLVAMEDEDLVITVAVTINNNLDADELGNWDVDATSLRFFDADGVATTEDGAPVTNDTATFEIREEGADDEVIVKTSSSDPEATTILLQDDKKETGTAFAFDIDTDDSANDVMVTEIRVQAVTTSGDLTDYVNDAVLIVDGEEVDTEDVTVAADEIVFEFDDGDFMIDAGDRVTVELEVEFDALDGGEEGDSLSFSLDGSTDVDSEGADDITASGAASGDTHIMITEGIVILADGVETDENTSGSNDSIGNFTIEFEVTAYENDFYIATSGVNFSVEGGSATTTFTVTATGDEDTTGVFTVSDGETETFTLNVTVDPDATAQFRVTLDSVEFSTNTNGVTGAETRTLSPATDYRTGFELVQGVAI